MARPLKKALGYFPLDTDLFADRKIQRLTRRYGSEGVCTYLSVLCEIYGEQGYYAVYDSDFCFGIGYPLNLEEERVAEIIAFCMEVNLFNGNLFAAYGILTSEAIQRRYREISKRTQFSILPELAVSATEMTDNGQNLPENGVNSPKSAVNVTGTPENEEKLPASGVSVAKTPLNNINTINKKNINRQKGYEEKSDRKRPSSDDGAAQRRNELLRMAREATGGC